MTMSADSPGGKASTGPTGPKKATGAKKATSAKKATNTKKTTGGGQGPAARKPSAAGKPGKRRKRTISFDEIRKSGYWDRARERAKNLLEDEERLGRVLEEADRKPTGGKRGKLSEVLEELKALLRLVRAYVKGDYRDVSWENMVLIVAAIVYFVSPLDLIPDPLPGIGHMDDAVVIAWTIRMVREEIDEFLDWESSNETS